MSLAPAGRYVYRIKGHADSTFGAQDIDGRSTLTVDPPRDGRQHSTERNDRGTSEQDVLARHSGLYLADLSFDQDGFHEAFQPEAPVLLLPASAESGRRWQWSMSSTDGSYHLTAHLQVRSVRGSGATSTVSIDSVLHITGNNVDVTMHRSDVARSDGVALRGRARTDGTAYGTHFSSDVTRTLQPRS